MFKFTKTKTKHVIPNRGICYRIKNLQGVRSILAVILICSLGLVYLIEINSIAVKGFEIKELEKKIEHLKEQNKKLNLDMTELQSTERIQNRVDKLGLVISQNIEYIKVGVPVVAVK